MTAFKYGNNAVDAAFGYSSDRLQVTSLSYKKVGDANPFFSLTYGYGSAGSPRLESKLLISPRDEEKANCT